MKANYRLFQVVVQILKMKALLQIQNHHLNLIGYTKIQKQKKIQ